MLNGKNDVMEINNNTAKSSQSHKRAVTRFFIVSSFVSLARCSLPTQAEKCLIGIRFFVVSTRHWYTLLASSSFAIPKFLTAFCTEVTVDHLNCQLFSASIESLLFSLRTIFKWDTSHFTDKSAKANFSPFLFWTSMLLCAQRDLLPQHYTHDNCFSMTNNVSFKTTWKVKLGMSGVKFLQMDASFGWVGQMELVGNLTGLRYLNSSIVTRFKNFLIGELVGPFGEHFLDYNYDGSRGGHGREFSSCGRFSSLFRWPLAFPGYWPIFLNRIWCTSNWAIISN